MTHQRSRPDAASGASALIDELTQRLRATAEDVVPWFLGQMPRRYFQDTDEATRLTHLTAILAARASEVPLRITLKNADESEWTFIHENDYPGLLADLMTQLPRARALESAKVHTTEDDGLVLDVFRFRPVVDDSADADADSAGEASAASDKKRARILAYAEREGLDEADRAGMAEFMAACSDAYIATVTPFRLLSSYKLCRGLLGTDDTRVGLEPEEGDDCWRISVATGNAMPNDVFARIARQLSHELLDIHRGYLDVFGAGDRSILRISFVVRCVGDEPLGTETPLWRRVRRDLARIKWLDRRTLELARDHRQLGLLRAEVLVALGHLIHPSLARENNYVYAKERIHDTCVRELGLATAIVDLLLGAHDPDAPLPQTEVDAAMADLLLRIEREADDPVHRRVLTQLLLAVQSTQYTNAFIDGRYGLAIRFDPKHLGQPQRADDPFGAFFVHGRGFNGFHLRFRDIARGGVRVVLPRGPEQHALESERLYNEVYELAFAQQLKNKDIPEGGAKAVILVEPEATSGAPPGKALAGAVKAFADSLLDLLVPDDAVGGRIANRSSTERVYLGPDENISPALIEWIVDRAHRRGYPTPNAFMSSKPGAGINHKEYGVTSEGVTVFLEEALREIGIDPRTQPFTVKITGGPDGDVAGNEIRILAREFGANVRIVGIADGSGCAEDPDGLDLPELLRLFGQAAPIAVFDRAKLGPNATLIAVDEPGGAKRRNTMHNRVVADAFVPAGGRPETIHEGNWREFLGPDGAPTSRVIVEGANLFLTPRARALLSTEAGVVIVKDSSANKCGVICSSYEIAASMLLSSEELLTVKERFVAEVIDKLRELAWREAQLLFRERRHNPTLPLPELSTRLSQMIIRATDAIATALDTLADRGDDELTLLRSLVVEHLPAVLIERVGPQIVDKLPPAYLSSMIAATLATKIVYREGLDYLVHLDDRHLAELAVRYLRQERETEALIREVAESSLPNRERIAALLRAGGARAGLITSR